MPLSPEVKLYRVFNNRSQPVELHFGQQVIVIPPNGMLELDETILAAEQVQRLHASGSITIHPVPAEPKSPSIHKKESQSTKLEKHKHSKSHNHSGDSKKEKKKK